MLVISTFHYILALSRWQPNSESSSGSIFVKIGNFPGNFDVIPDD